MKYKLTTTCTISRVQHLLGSIINYNVLRHDVRGQSKFWASILQLYPLQRTHSEECLRMCKASIYVGKSWFHSFLVKSGMREWRTSLLSLKHRDSYPWVTTGRRSWSIKWRCHTFWLILIAPHISWSRGSSTFILAVLFLFSIYLSIQWLARFCTLKKRRTKFLEANKMMVNKSGCKVGAVLINLKLQTRPLVKKFVSWHSHRDLRETHWC